MYLTLYGMGIDSVLLFLTLLVCVSSLLVCKTRINFPYRVNCWFCNNSFWIKFQDRNSWTCKICEQYNGFNKDGDYNKPLPMQLYTVKSSPKSFGRAQNGLCMECNIRQELKVLYLADFVPLKNYDKEIETFRSQMEKYSKLCSPCRKVVQKKLRKDKNKLLLIPLTKTAKRLDTKYHLLISKIERAYIVIAAVLFLLVSVDILVNIIRSYRDLITIDTHNAINILKSMFSSVKMEMFTAFSGFENMYKHISNTGFMSYTSHIFSYGNAEKMCQYSDLVQKYFGAVGLALQIMGALLQYDTLKNIFDTLLWAMFVVASFAHSVVPGYPLLMFIIKDICVVAVLVLSAQTKDENHKDYNVENKTSPRGIRHLVTGKVDSLIDDEESSDMETDDVSLSKYVTNSSNSVNTSNNTLLNGKPFTYNDSIWTKPRLNPRFCVNSMTNRASSAFPNIPAKPKIDYFAQKQHYSNSDLDESINSLYIGSPKKVDTLKTNYFTSQTAPPRYTISPLSTVSQRRPLISPSRLGHSTSWVAGGYWDADGNRSGFSTDGSPTSSQSSGFDSWSQTSSQRNLFSHPPSREESVCSEIDKSAAPSEALRNCSINSFGGSFQSHRKVPLVYPDLRYDGHIHIPQPIYSNKSQSSSNSMIGGNISQQFQYVNTFKTPGGFNKFSRIN